MQRQSFLVGECHQLKMLSLYLGAERSARQNSGLTGGGHVGQLLFSIQAQTHFVWYSINTL